MMSDNCPKYFSFCSIMKQESGIKPFCERVSINEAYPACPLYKTLVTYDRRIRNEIYERVGKQVAEKLSRQVN